MVKVNQIVSLMMITLGFESFHIISIVITHLILFVIQFSITQLKGSFTLHDQIINNRNKPRKKSNCNIDENPSAVHIYLVNLKNNDTSNIEEIKYTDFTNLK